MFTLIPKIFYADRTVGLDLFVDGLGFEVGHQDATLTVIAREGAKACMVERAEYAAKDRHDLAIETDRIEEIHADIAKRRPRPAASEPAEADAAPVGCDGVRVAGFDVGVRRAQAVVRLVRPAAP